MIGHIAKRIAFVVLGYFAGLAAGAASLPGILLIISAFIPGSELWQWMGLGPIMVIAAPIVLFYVMWIVMVITFIPAVILKGLTEIFGWRRIWVHLVIAQLLAGGAGLLLVPDWFSAMNLDRWLITAAVMLSAVVGGIVYWAIAGRMAGLRQEDAKILPTQVRTSTDNPPSHAPS